MKRSLRETFHLDFQHEDVLTGNQVHFEIYCPTSNRPNTQRITNQLINRSNQILCI
jgi:hypothetical protein